MLGALERAIVELDLAVDEGQLRAALALRDRLEARIAEAVAEVDVAELWRGDGSVSMAAWLRRSTRMTADDAKRAVASSRLARACPAVGEAWRDGRLSTGQVRVVSANVTEPLVPLFADHAPAVVPTLEPLDLPDTATAMQTWALRAKVALALEGELPEKPKRAAHLSPTLDGRGRLDADLDPEAYELARTALRLAESRDAEGEARTPAERRADALVDICRHFLDHQHGRIAGRHRPHVNAVIDVSQLATGEGGRTLQGTPLDPATIRRMLCDANVHRVVTDGRSSILDYGRATRTIPPALYTSLVLRDLRCRFPGCDRPPEWTEGHHIWHWEDGGPTELSNLVLLCCRHHHVIHQRGWEVKLLPSGVVEVTRPDGRVMSSDPPLRP